MTFNQEATLLRKSTALLATALMIGEASTALAAGNPFIDVPRDHWAYDAVIQLAVDGVIEGYGDGTFHGARNITRYEMAQMIAKALAKNPRGTDRATVDRLAAEFEDELKGLGVKVDELERHADNVMWNGKIEYTYASERVNPLNEDRNDKWNYNGYLFRLEPTAPINDHWSLLTRLDAEVGMKDGSSTDVYMSRGYVEGDYDRFNVKLGRQALYTNESGLIFDAELSGASLAFGSKLNATLYAGRLSTWAVGGGIYGWHDSDNDPTSIQGINVGYDVERGLYGGAAYYRLKDDDLQSDNYSANAREDTADIWSLNAGYRFGSKALLWGAYADNTRADYENYSWQAALDLGNYGDNPEKGDWALWAGYRRYGTNVSFAASTDDVLIGTKGWFVGGAYAPLKNMGVAARYFNGEYINGGGDAEKLFGRVEFFF